MVKQLYRVFDAIGINDLGLMRHVEALRMAARDHGKRCRGIAVREWRPICFRIIGTGYSEISSGA